MHEFVNWHRLDILCCCLNCWFSGPIFLDMEERIRATGCATDQIAVYLVGVDEWPATNPRSNIKCLNKTIVPPEHKTWCNLTKKDRQLILQKQWLRKLPKLLLIRISVLPQMLIDYHSCHPLQQLSSLPVQTQPLR